MGMIGGVGGLESKRLLTCIREPLAEKVADDAKAIPERLKPQLLRRLQGPPEAERFDDPEHRQADIL